MTDRSTLVVSSRSWHGRLYHFWRENSTFKNGHGDTYRENLCHYVRVIVLWGPLSMFLCWAPTKWKGVTPASVLVTITMSAGLGYVAINHPLDTLGVFLSGLGGLIVFVGVITFVKWIGDHQEEIEQWWRSNGLGTWPLKAIGRTLAYKVLKVPVGGLLILAGIAAGSIFGDIVVLITVLCVVAGFALLLVVGYVGGLIHEGVLHRRSIDRDESAVKVAARALVAKKQGICPFIEVEQS